MRLSPLILSVAVIAGTATLEATTHSFYDKGYNFSTLKTFDFKNQRRISQDPIADNRIWGDRIRAAIQSHLQGHGFELQTADHADFLVAFYVGLRERYDFRVMDYGYPGFWGPRRFGWRWGWPDGFDIWRIPYTDSTLIIDVIDSQTNQLVWRGYNTDIIHVSNPDEDFKDAVDDLLKRFYKDIKLPSRT